VKHPEEVTASDSIEWVADVFPGSTIDRVRPNTAVPILVVLAEHHGTRA